MSGVPSFAELAAAPDAALDGLTLALAAEFRDVDAARAVARLDVLGAELAHATERTDGDAVAQAIACRQLLGVAQGFAGDRKHYDHPDNSMLDVVLTRRRGLPILLSVVYVEVARRAGMALAGVGLPGHFVVGHFGADPPLLLDPFAGGRTIPSDGAQVPLRPWRAPEIAMRMLNNLVATYQRCGDLSAAIRAGKMRLELPADASLHEALEAELQAMQARLN